MKAIVEENDSGQFFIVYNGDNIIDLPGPLEDARYTLESDMIVLYWVNKNIVLGYN